MQFSLGWRVKDAALQAYNTRPKRMFELRNENSDSKDTVTNLNYGRHLQE
jgi:hypothetical protein